MHTINGGRALSHEPHKRLLQATPLQTGLKKITSTSKMNQQYPTTTPEMEEVLLQSTYVSPMEPQQNPFFPSLSIMIQLPITAASPLPYPYHQQYHHCLPSIDADTKPSGKLSTPGFRLRIWIFHNSKGQKIPYEQLQT